MSATMTVDPITAEVVRHKLEGIANEMELTLLQSSFSPIVREGQDASASLFTAKGETLAQAVANPLHLATMLPIVSRIMTDFPPSQMKEGDIYLMNDPYLGGTHLPDLTLVMPIFFDRQIVAYSTAMTHHQDVGGMSPGSVPTNATEIFQEGLRLPPLKLRDGAHFNEAIFAILRQNSRVPDDFIGDLHAQIAACTVASRRVKDLAHTFGFQPLQAIFDHLLNRAEIMTRAALRAFPNGTYHYTDYNDNDGINLDNRIKIEVAVTIKDGTFHCDFTKSSDQVRGPFNVVPSGALAASYFGLLAVVGPDIPANGGCFRAVTLDVRRGSIFNPIEPAPVNSRSATVKRAASVVLGALRKLRPELIGADAAGVDLVLMFGGMKANGKPYVVGEIIAGGSGAGPFRDGVDVIETDVSNCMNLPVEALELDAPIRVHRTSIRQNSGGPGKSRGGLGLIREYELLEGEATFTHRGERHFCAAQGAEGGLPGQTARSVIMRQNGSEDEVPSKLVTRIYAGDRIRVETAGGGGYGAPAERSPDAVQQDLANGKIDLKEATNSYGHRIELDPRQSAL